MRQRGLSSERGREKRPRQKGKGRNTLASLLPLKLLQTGTAFLTYRANQRQGMVLRMQAQDQYKDYLETVIINKDTNLNLRSNFETGAHSMCQITRWLLHVTQRQLIVTLRQSLTCIVRSKAWEGPKNVFNALPCFSKIRFTLPVMLGGMERVWIILKIWWKESRGGYSSTLGPEQQGLLPWAPHFRGPHSGSPSAASLPLRWEVCSVKGICPPRIYAVPFLPLLWVLRTLEFPAPMALGLLPGSTWASPLSQPSESAPCRSTAYL